jgi:hypothetical protein
MSTALIGKYFLCVHDECWRSGIVEAPTPAPLLARPQPPRYRHHRRVPGKLSRRSIQLG